MNRKPGSIKSKIQEDICSNERMGEAGCQLITGAFWESSNSSIEVYLFYQKKGNIITRDQGKSDFYRRKELFLGDPKMQNK